MTAIDHGGDGVRWISETGFEIEPEYGPWHLRSEYEDALGSPGSYPYTRHIRPTGYRDRAWQPALYSGFGDPADANERFRFLLSEGNGRVSVAFDLPTQLGLDSDNPRARHEVDGWASPSTRSPTSKPSSTVSRSRRFQSQ